MDLGSAFRVLLRRWILVLIGVVLTLGTAGYFYKAAIPTYRAEAQLLLLLPADARDTEEPESPFLYLPNGLNVLAELVSVEPESHSFQESMAESGLSSSFEIDTDPTSPIIFLGVNGVDSKNVLRTRDWLLEELDYALERIQLEENVPERQTAHFRVYAADDVVSPVFGNRTRGTLAVVAAGGLITILTIFAIDRLLLTYRTKHPKRRLLEDEDEDSLL